MSYAEYNNNQLKTKMQPKNNLNKYLTFRLPVNLPSKLSCLNRYSLCALGGVVNALFKMY